MQHIIVILGYANDAKGNLRTISKERANKALECFRKSPGALLLPTGGFGKRWNTTSVAHSEYVKRYLISQGVRQEDFFGVVPSGNTYEDAAFTKSLTQNLGQVKLTVVTSDFHRPRAEYLFRKVFKDTSCELAFEESKPSTLWTGFSAALFSVREKSYLKRLQERELGVTVK